MRQALDAAVDRFAGSTPAIRQFRSALGEADEEIFDQFLAAIVLGDEQLDEAARHAASGNPQGGRPLDLLEQERRQLEGELAASADPVQQRQLMDRLEQVTVEAAWKHLLPIYLPAAHQVGAEHAEPDAATLSAYPLPPPPKPRRR
jgi:hypothetical protein